MIQEPGASSPAGRAPQSGESESLSGVVRNVIYRNEQSGFTVLSVVVKDTEKPARLVGEIGSIEAGEQVVAAGQWVDHPKHGRQFRARHVAVAIPTGREGLLGYLGSGAVHGVGPVYAEAIVDQFGDETVDVLDRHPDRLREVEGIGPKRAQQIAESWAERRDDRETLMFLHQHGIGAARSATISRVYGQAAASLIKANPYRLIRDFRGIGFLTADAIARSVGIEPSAPERLTAGVAFAVHEAVREGGHTGVPAETLVERARALLDCEIMDVEAALERESVPNGPLVADSADGTDCVFPRVLYEAERQIAADLARLASGSMPWPPLDLAQGIESASTALAMNLGADQEDALRMALTSKVMVMTGGPGVGKTTILNAFFHLVAERGVSFELCAPTGRAAKRMAEASNREARTIHRLLEFNPVDGRFLRGRDRPLDSELIVVDEVSMVDVELMASLLEAIPDRAALLLVGDADQLPSVRAGQVLADVIASRAFPVSRLREVFRQAEGSQILRVAHRINAGEPIRLGTPQDPEGDFFFVPAKDQSLIADRIAELVRTRIPRRFGLDPVRDIQVLSPMRTGDAGVDALNARLQRELNGNAGEGVRVGLETLRRGDRVMQGRNNYQQEVFNGDIGYVELVSPRESVAAVRIDGRRVDYGVQELDALSLAYAVTIHKSQGSEYPAVVIALHGGHHVMLRRNLLYTAVTRGKRLVVLVGEEQAVHRAIRTGRRDSRVTKLREWIGDGVRHGTS